MPTPRRTRPHAGKLRSLIGLTVAAVLLVAACGSDDDGDAASGPAASTTARARAAPPTAQRRRRPRPTSSPSRCASATSAPASRPGAVPRAMPTRPVSCWIGSPRSASTKIETFGFANGPEVSQAIAGGSLDIAGYGDTPALNGRASGLPTRAIGQSRVDLSATLYTPKDGVTTVEELDGKTIGVAQGSFMHRFVLGFLEAEGLADSVTVTNIPVAEYVPALTAGDVAAVVVPWSLAPLYDAQGFRPLVSTFPDYPDLAGSSVTVFTEDALEGASGSARGLERGPGRGAEAHRRGRRGLLRLPAADPEGRSGRRARPSRTSWRTTRPSPSPRPAWRCSRAPSPSWSRSARPSRTSRCRSGSFPLRDPTVLDTHVPANDP